MSTEQEETIMEEVLYADVLLLIDFSMDFLSLCAAGKLFSLPTSYFRLLLGSLLGGIGCVLITVFSCPRWMAFGGSVLLSVGMTRIAFRWRGSRGGFARAVCTVWGSGALLAGLLTLFSGMMPETYISGYGECVAAAGMMLFGIVRAVRRRTACGYAEIRITVSETGTFCGRALVDSGNLLREPVSDLPVILVSSRVFSVLWEDAGNSVETFSSGIRAIPVHSVTGNRILYGRICRNIEIRHGGKMFLRTAVVCADNGAAAGGFGDADALVPASVL